ncbi:MAG: methyltransferase [Sphingomonas sp. SCN 67-18]|uniref:class I SAM-dependent methyltransferase n=1 Tax=uncultured Sphingomonas sp. TaxID=158754 RepID=UPI00086AEA0D|nr:class I SAM-dependent methyltransferase [Sphingomonas sp. SCN 67-18]ODU22006.1 MAG: methyltransferase [Sphingomonas sp. SCN 67-18]
MKRETVNAIRTVLEEAIPPFIRDSGPMRWLFRRHWGPLIDDIERFRERIPFVTADEYRAVYERMPRVQDDTDNSEACLKRIAAAVEGQTVLDVGCGTGYLLDWLKQRRGDLTLTGTDFIIEPGTRTRHADIRFVEGHVERLPFEDGSFDTVICTHVLEHILDFRGALAELRRVAGKRLILVVPREREYRFTFNPHLHFFPYPHSFLRYLPPIPAEHVIEGVGRDIFYSEKVGPAR